MTKERVRFAPPITRRSTRPPLYDLLWPRPGRPVYGVFIADGHQILQAPFHWCKEDRRTIPCPGEQEKCGWCLAGVSNAFKTYIGSWNHKTGKTFALVLGEESWSCLAEHSPPVSLRGLLYVASRVSGPTSLVKVSIHKRLPVDELFRLRECPDFSRTIEWLNGGHAVKAFG